MINENNLFFNHEDAVKFIANETKIDSDIISEVLVSKLNYMKSVGLAIKESLDVLEEQIEEKSVLDDYSDNTEDGGIACNTKYAGAASNKGLCGTSVNKGAYGNSINEGDFGTSINVGDDGASINKGESGVSINAGDNNGYLGASRNEGKFGASINTGCYGVTDNTGDGGVTCSTGHRGFTCNKGLGGTSVNTGEFGKSYNEGKFGASVNTGDTGISENTGYGGVAINIGRLGSTYAGNKNSIAVAWGPNSKAKGVKGAFLVLTEWRYSDTSEFSWELIDSVMVQVDGKKIKENTWYQLIDKKVTERVIFTVMK